MKAEDDRALLQAWTAGDARAGQVLFRRHFEPVFRFFCNKVGPEVDDLVQDTFLTLAKVGDRFRAEASFRTFLFGIAYKQLLKSRDRWAKDGRLDAFDAERALAVDTSPSRAAARHEEQRLLLRALRRLDLDLQVTLELFYWEDCTSAEISEILGIPHGTVRSRIRRGRGALAQRLAELAASPALVESTRQGLETWLSSMRRHVELASPG